MPTKYERPSAPAMPNSSPELAQDFVDVEARLQALGHDVDALKAHLMDPLARSGVGARVMACMLSAAVLQEWLCRMQITELGRK